MDGRTGEPPRAPVAVVVASAKRARRFRPLVVRPSPRDAELMAAPLAPAIEVRVKGLTYAEWAFVYSPRFRRTFAYLRQVRRARRRARDRYCLPCGGLCEKSDGRWSARRTFCQRDN